MSEDRTTDREALIRERAYILWVEAGRPEGQADDHWHAARAAIDEEESVVTPLHDISADPAPLVPPNR